MAEEGAPKALIRAARPGLEVGGLDDGWCPTGAAWLGVPLIGGRARWVPVSTTEPLGEPGGLPPPETPTL
jgi:hypothetical protein